MMRVVAVAIVCTLAVPAILFAQRSGFVQPFVEIEDVEVKPLAFEQTKGGKPFEIESKEDAAKFFDEASLEKLTEKVDFRKQFVLVLDWKGSGQDRLIVRNAATDAEQFIFEIVPGKTRDLKPHVRVFALRLDAKWEAK